MNEVGRRFSALVTRRRIRTYAAIVFTCNFLQYFLALVIAGDPPYDGFGHPIAVDFVNRFTAGRFVLEGKIHWIYSVPLQIATQQEFLGASHPQSFAPFISPASVAYLYAPFAAAPYLVGVGLWTCLSLTLFFLSIRLLWPLVPDLHRFGLGTVLLIALSSWPVIELVLDGQDSALSLFILVAGLRLLLARHDFAAGAILGLGAFKPQVFLLMPLLLILQRRWSGLGGWTATTLTIAATSAMLVGSEGIQSYVALVTSDMVRDGLLNLNWKMLSLVALARSVLAGPLASLDAAATAVTAIAVVAFFVHRARQPSQGSRQFVLLYALAVVGGVIASPYLFVYDCTVLIIPALILLNEATPTSTVRLSLVSAYLLLWSGPLRFAAVGKASWPLSVLAGPWAAVPILVMAMAIYRLIPKSGAADDIAPVYSGVEPQLMPEAIHSLRQGRK